MRAASLNHIDVWVRKGLPSVPKPRILGSDGAGVIAGTDERVVINPALFVDGKMNILGEQRDGTHAELIAVPREFVHPIPAGLSFEQAAAFPWPTRRPTACSSRAARLKEGEWVLVGGSAAAWRWRPSRSRRPSAPGVVATSSTEEKLARARELGADAALNHQSDDVVAAVKELTGGGVDVVVETVGEPTWRRSLDSARRGGRIVVCGATAGPNPPAGLPRIWWKELEILGSTMGTPDDFAGVLALLDSGKAVPVVDTVMPLSEIRAAHERLESGAQLGKIVLSIPG